MHFVIDRSKWRCGGNDDPLKPHQINIAIGSGGVSLLNDDGFMCCLGQVCKQSAVPDYFLDGSGDPAGLGDTFVSKFISDYVDSAFLNQSTNQLTNQFHAAMNDVFSNVDFLLTFGINVDFGLMSDDIPGISNVVCNNTSFAEEAMNINDNAEISQEEREAALTQLFVEHGHTIEFINEPVYCTQKGDTIEGYKTSEIYGPAFRIV